MGGSFSAQAVDLHSLWGVYTHRHLFHALGFLNVWPEGFAWWDGLYRRVSLCRFHNNVLIATDFEDSPETPIVQTICNMLH